MKTIASHLGHPADPYPQATPIYSLVLHDAGAYTMFDGACHRSVDTTWARSLHMRELIERSGLSSREVAEKLQVSKRTVENWRALSSAHRNPPAAMIRLAEITLGSTEGVQR